MIELFVTCSQGIEPLLLRELEQLGYSKLKEGFRGVYVTVSGLSDVYRINYCSRLGGRVLLPIMNFRCQDRDDLYRKVSRLDWNQYMSVDRTFAIDANVTHRAFRNSLYAAQVMKDGICDYFRDKTGRRPSVDTQEPDVQLNLFIRDYVAVVSLDTSGKPLHKRGYRQDAGPAPIQESLAAALLAIAGYQGHEIVCDPFCGSGTLLIEAALMASHTAPGFLRRQWGFMNLPDFKETEWLRVKMEADEKRRPLPKGHFFGCDNNRDVVRICKGNLRAAGVFSDVEVTASDFRDYTPPTAPDFIITNPPHGKRLDDLESLRPLYRALGDWMKQHAAKPGRGFVFTSQELAKEVGLAPKKRNVLDNSGVDSRFLEFDLF